jgi:hypothetical protein
MLTDLRRVLLLGVLATTGLPMAAQTAYVDSAAVEIGHQHVNNVVVTSNPYSLELRLAASSPDVTGVAVVPPPSTFIPFLVLPPTIPFFWALDDEPLSGGFVGTYTFFLFGVSGFLDLLSPTYTALAVGSIAVVTSPAPGATSVPLTPTFTWNAPAGWPSGAGINIEVYDITADMDLPGALLPITATSWTPPYSLSLGHSYQFEIGAFVSVTSVNLSAGGDSYMLCETYGEANSVFFATCGSPVAASEAVRLGTPPNPSALLPGLTSGPVIGATWDPIVDHSTFLPGALVDVLAISGTALNTATPAGTLLCLPISPGLIFTEQAGAAFEIHVPLDCALVGAAFCSQAASLQPGSPIALTNALDLVIGSF